MTVVSSKEFVSNEEKYFNLAKNEQVFVQRDNIMFILTRAKVEKKYKEPDDDFRRAITMDKLLEGVLEDIHHFYAPPSSRGCAVRVSK